jgi:hypothetical protein
LQAEEAKPHFIIKKNSHYSIQCRVKAAPLEFDLGDNEAGSPLFFLYNNQAYLWKSNDVIHLVEKFLPTGKMATQPIPTPGPIAMEIIAKMNSSAVVHDRNHGKSPGHVRPSAIIISRTKTNPDSNSLLIHGVCSMPLSET